MTKTIMFMLLLACACDQDGSTAGRDTTGADGSTDSSSALECATPPEFTTEAMGCGCYDTEGQWVQMDPVACGCVVDGESQCVCMGVEAPPSMCDHCFEENGLCFCNGQTAPPEWCSLA